MRTGQNLLCEKELLPHVKTTKPTGHQRLPVGFDYVCKTRAIARLRAIKRG